MNVHNQKYLSYNFPIKLDSSPTRKIPESFYKFYSKIPIKLNNLNYDHKDQNTLEYESILDSGSYCNFISKELINKLNLRTQTTNNIIQIKGISGTTKINEYIKLYFQTKISINNSIYLITFKEKFLVTDQIPTALLLGNKFMEKYKLHYNYNNKIIFTDSNFNHFKKKFLLSKNYKKFHKEFIYKKLNSPNFNNYKNLNKINF